MPIYEYRCDCGHQFEKLSRYERLTGSIMSKMRRKPESSFGFQRAVLPAILIGRTFLPAMYAAAVRTQAVHGITKPICRVE